MTIDRITEVTRQSWGSRLSNSLKGIFFGVVLICIAIGVLWWNEGRAVKRAQALDEGAGQVVTVATDRIDTTNEGKLVHLSGQATTEETLIDPVFNVQVQAIKLSREVQMFQWREHIQSNTQEKIGGGTETVTTYTYDKGWESRVVTSSNFKQPNGHQNPGNMLYEQWRAQAQDVTLGAFQLSSSLISQIDRSKIIQLNENSGVYLSTPNSHLKGSEIYIGVEPQSPQIGDLRIQFKAVYPTDVSLVSVQRGESFVPYVASNGNQIELLVETVRSAQQMFQAAQDENTYLTWAIRAGGFLCIFIGFRMLFGVIPIVAAVIPALGSLVGTATSLLSLILAGLVSLVTFGTAWIYYRPLLGISLLVSAGVLMAGLKWVRTKKTSQPEPQAT
jgi:hypothetical protein